MLIMTVHTHTYILYTPTFSMQVLHVTYNIELLQAIRRGVGDNIISIFNTSYYVYIAYYFCRLLYYSLIGLLY